MTLQATTPGPPTQETLELSFLLDLLLHACDLQYLLELFVLLDLRFLLELFYLLRPTWYPVDGPEGPQDPDRPDGGQIQLLHVQTVFKGTEIRGVPYSLAEQIM